MGIISELGSFRGRFGDHFSVGDHFGVGIISGAVQFRHSNVPLLVSWVDRVPNMERE